MGKFASTDVLDGSLNIVRGATRMVALNGEPATYAVAFAGRLAEAVLTTADFTLAAGDVSGRKVSVAARSGLPRGASGAAGWAKAGRLVARSRASGARRFMELSNRGCKEAMKPWRCNATAATA